MTSLHHPDLRLLWTLWLCHLNVCLYFIQKPLIRPFAHKHTHWWQRATAYGEDSSACGQEEQGIDPPLWRTLCTSWATSATYASPMCLFDQMHERWTYKVEYQQKKKNLNTLSSVYQMYFFMFWKRSERHLLCFIKTDTTVTETTKEWHHQLPGIRCSLCVCLHVTKHECYIVVPPLDAIMSSTLVIRQPKPVMEARESDEWDSGICDCCQDVPECKCLCLSDCLILTPAKV